MKIDRLLTFRHRKLRPNSLVAGISRAFFFWRTSISWSVSSYLGPKILCKIKCTRAIRYIYSDIRDSPVWMRVFSRHGARIRKYDRDFYTYLEFRFNMSFQLFAFVNGFVNFFRITEVELSAFVIELVVILGYDFFILFLVLFIVRLYWSKMTGVEWFYLTKRIFQDWQYAYKYHTYVQPLCSLSW